MTTQTTTVEATVLKTFKGKFIAFGGDHRGIPSKMLPIPGSLVASVHESIEAAHKEADRLNAIARVTNPKIK